MANVGYGYRPYEPQKTELSDESGNVLGLAKSGSGSGTSAIGGNITYQYPLDHEWNQAPFILFSRKRAEYNTGYNNAAVTKKAISQVAMYMPMGVNMADNAQWEMLGSGFIGSLMANGDSVGGSLSKLMDLGANVVKSLSDDSVALDKAAIALGRTYGDELIGLGAAVTGAANSAAGAVIGGGATYAVARQAFNELAKNTQVSLNPREFMLYRAPSMRTFQLDFRFVPKSEKEALSALNIIKEFRTSMYPELASLIVPDSTYSFPDVWTISFENTTGIPRIPEVAITDVSVTYNPNSMSFFTPSDRAGGIPVEIAITLSFSEITPINRRHIDGGY